MTPWSRRPQSISTQDISLIEKMCALVEPLSPKASSKMRSFVEEVQSPKAVYKCSLVDEIPHFPTVVLDLDGTLIHTLVDPIEIAAAKESDMRTIRLPGKMGIVVERPGLEELFSSLLGYNVVVYSAGGSAYVNAVVAKLVANNPFMRGIICNVLCRSDLVKYSMLSNTEVPSDTPLDTVGVLYVKDLRKARQDGNSRKVVIVDDNPYAFQVHPDMKDMAFKKRYNFSLNALPVSDFNAKQPEAVFDKAFARVGRVLGEIVGEEDTVGALNRNSISL